MLAIMMVTAMTVVARKRQRRVVDKMVARRVSLRSE